MQTNRRRHIHPTPHFNHITAKHSIPFAESIKNHIVKYGPMLSIPQGQSLTKRRQTIIQKPRHHTHDLVSRMHMHTQRHPIVLHPTPQYPRHPPFIILITHPTTQQTSAKLWYWTPQQLRAFHQIGIRHGLFNRFAILQHPPKRIHRKMRQYQTQRLISIYLRMNKCVGMPYNKIARIRMR